MLALFRRSQKIWLWALLILMIPLFVLWGTSSRTPTMNRRPPQLMGTYNQKKIMDEDLRRAMRGATIELRIQGMTAEDVNKDPQRLEIEAWRRILQANEATAAGIVVSPEELGQFVREKIFGNQPINPYAYQNVIQQLGGRMTPREFEDHLRDTLAIAKLRQSLFQTSLVSDEEVRQAYESQRTLIKLAYVPFYYSNYYPKTTLDTNDIAQYYAARQDVFSVPEQVDVMLGFVRMDTTGVKVTPESVEDFYDQYKKAFIITNDVDDATNTSNDVSYKPFASVSNMITALLVSNEASDIASDLASRLYDEMTGPDAEKAADKEQLFRNAAKRLKIPIFSSGLVSQRGSVPGVTNSAGLVTLAFSMKPGEVTDVQFIQNAGCAIMFVKDKREAYLPALTNIEAKVRDELRREMALQSAYYAASNLNARICAMPTSFTNAAAMLKYRARVTLPFDRATGSPDLGCPPQIVSRLFAYPVNTSVVAPFMGGYLLACPIEVIEPDYGLLKNYENDIKGQLMYQHQALLYNMWLTQMEQKKLKRVGTLVKKESLEPGTTGPEDAGPTDAGPDDY